MINQVSSVLGMEDATDEVNHVSVKYVISKSVPFIALSI